MRKIYFLLFTLFSIIATTQNLFSQTVTIGDGTDVQRQPLTYYYGYGRSAMIYTAAEMGTTGSGASVISVAFYCNTPENTGPTIIYLQEAGTETTQTEATWASKIALATKAYDGTPAIDAAGWRTITLTSPFPLAANQNLEVLVETNFGEEGTPPSTGNDMRYSVVSNSHQYWEQDNSAPVIAGTVNDQRPNIQFVFGPPILCVAPPGGGTTQGPAGTVCAGVSFDLAVNGASFGTGITYQWESSPDQGVWSPVAGATGANLTTSQHVTTYYRRKITCSGQDSYSTPLLVAMSPAISGFPWTESFDATTIPLCWSNQYVEGAYDWEYVSENQNGSITPRTGAGMAQFYTEDFGLPITKLVTPRLDITSLANPRVRFYYANVNWFGDIDELRVYYKSSAAGPWIQIGADYVTEHTTWTEVVLALPNPSNDYYIAFEGTSYFARGLDLDDVTVEETPPCAPPAGLSASDFTPVSATINWQAAITPPAGGYEWEIRTAGVAGSGAAGLEANGSTLPAVLSASVTGLAVNTGYTLYVRTVCTAGLLYSAWSPGFNFRTPCDPLISFPYTETFEETSPTRSCWWPVQVSGTVNWTYGAGAGNGGSITAAHGGTVNANLSGEGSGSVAKLVSPAFDFSSMPPALGAQLSFWYANEDWFGDLNELRVYYKTSAAGAWTLIPGAVYTASTPVWTEVELLLPSSTGSEYYIAFEGVEQYGFGAVVDDVTIKATPSCPKPKDVNVLAPTTTTAIASFTSPGNSFIVEYGAAGFTPGTGATAGGGTIVTGTASPIAISGLTPGTLYDFYVRRECDPGVDYSENVKITVSSQCDPVGVPYFQDFETAIEPDFPSCTSMEDVNGNSGPLPNVGGGRWTTFVSASGETHVSPTQVMRYLYDFGNTARGADDWFYIQGLNLTGGTSYRLKFFYKGSNGPEWTEGLEVKYGTMAHSSAMTNTIYSNNNIVTALADPWDSARVDFTPDVTGVYYIGFHAISLPDQAFLYIDDISVEVTPLVDVGAMGLTGVPVCPAPEGVINTSITNYDIRTLDFSVYPVTVTADITGAATTVLTTVLNSGTLAPGASMNVAFPAFDYTAGSYNVIITANSPDDPATANNSSTASFFVNRSPATAAVTPAAPVVCIGQSVQLATQFSTPPEEPVTLPAVSSGDVSIGVPDNGSAGITHTLAVAGVPAGASVASITVTLNLTHTWVNDMMINLRAPNGRILNLFNRKGGFAEADLVNTIITSAGAPGIPSSGAPYTGTYGPDAALGVGPTGYISDASRFSDLFGAGNGDWTLALRDNADGDFGILVSWSITVTYAFTPPKIQWAPLAGLFVNPEGTLGYFGENAHSVYAKPSATTTYTVTTTDPVTGCESKQEIVVTVNENPVVAINPLASDICLSDTMIALSATPAGGIWTGRGVSNDAFHPSKTALGAHTLSYAYTDALGCTTVSTTDALVEDCPDRMVLLRDSAVRVYPNPSDGRFTIQVKSTLYNKLLMRVYTSSGILVRTQQFTGLVYDRRIAIDLTNLPGGAYMVHLSYDGGVRTSEKTYPVIIGR